MNSGDRTRHRNGRGVSAIPEADFEIWLEEMWKALPSQTSPWSWCRCHLPSDSKGGRWPMGTGERDAKPILGAGARNANSSDPCSWSESGNVCFCPGQMPGIPEGSCSCLWCPSSLEWAPATGQGLPKTPVPCSTELWNWPLAFHGGKTLGYTLGFLSLSLKIPSLPATRLLAGLYCRTKLSWTLTLKAWLSSLSPSY